MATVRQPSKECSTSLMAGAAWTDRKNGRRSGQVATMELSTADRREHPGAVKLWWYHCRYRILAQLAAVASPHAFLSTQTTLPTMCTSCAGTA